MAHSVDENPSHPDVANAAEPTVVTREPADSLEDLESVAITHNPTLRRMEQEAAMAWDRTGYISALPDPSLSSMFYVPPMNFSPDRQVAEVQVMQMIPWLARLRTESQRAVFEALAAETEYEAERARVLAELRSNWFSLYVLHRQVEAIRSDQAELEALIAIANARIATGDAQPGDVLMATLELSNQQEQLIGYQQQIVATVAELNRLMGRESVVPIVPPAQITATLPDWNHDLLRDMAFQSQPELAAARLRTAATRLGIEVARLKRRPDLTLSTGWVAMDSGGGMGHGNMVGMGGDSWTIGVSTTLPYAPGKYNAMVSEAAREHYAAHATEEEISQRLDAQLRGLWEQALAAKRTVELYENTILPQARQALAANQKSLATNSIPFNRVVSDYRTLLGLQTGYHRALGQLATTVARIQQTVGIDLIDVPPTDGSP